MKPLRRGGALRRTFDYREGHVRHITAATVLQSALARVFGPDAVRSCRRLLAAGVRIGITDMTGPARHARTKPHDHREVDR